MRRAPIWITDAGLPAFRSLETDTQADVCVVGAGIAGLSVAYMLTQAGKTVIVVDDGEIGRGMTAVTTAHLTCMLDGPLTEIARIHGEQFAGTVVRSHQAAINRIESIVGDEAIDCGFERLPGFLFRAPEDDETALEGELAVLRRAGVNDAALVVRAPLREFDTGPCIAVPWQGQIHPLRYLAGLARAVRREGGEIYANTHADEIEGGTAARVRAGRHSIISDAVVVATNSPVNDRLAIHTKQAPYMTYVIAARIEPGTVQKALYWDTADPYHYVRLHKARGCEYLIVGGEDHKSGQADDTAERHGRLEHWARKRFPAMGAIEAAWGGQVMQSLDGVGYIGHNPLDAGNVFVVTGDSGTGLTHGTIAGLLLTDLILGRKNPWQKVYDPSRKPVRAAGTFIRETANMAAQFGDWLKPGEVASADAIPRGRGALLRDGKRILAVYRDARGALHEMSAVCNHLGCIVHWNESESSWDCPCHGSRYDKFGRVINGPANRDLEPLSPGKMRAG
jgi:glycine/D-amino acid oxidase-like deaminating enzyme/nitrite reductase/ring-hydroxylating ferredoxin subunit